PCSEAFGKTARCSFPMPSSWWANNAGMLQIAPTASVEGVETQDLASLHLRESDSCGLSARLLKERL
ncbi:MAG: hypothetical protein WEB30_06650, partial [Cyclobacteriaceae bacterium]